MITTFLDTYNTVFIIIAIVSIGIGIGFGKFAKMRLNPTMGSPTIWYERPPFYFRFLMLEEGLYGNIFWIVSILSAFVFKWWYVIAFILLYFLAAIFCGLFEGLYQRFTKQRLYGKWTFLKVLSLPLDFMVIKYVLEKLPNQIEIFGMNVSSYIILFLPAIILALPVFLAEIGNLVSNKR